MYRSLLVPLDGSELAEQALPLAEHLAMATGAELELIRVHVPPTAWDIYADAMTTGPEVHDTAPAEAAYLEEQGEAVPDSSGELVTAGGEVVGRHAGIHGFTVGQRKGLGGSLATAALNGKV